MSEAQKFDKAKYDARYVRDHYDKLSLLLPREGNYKERIRELADREGMSVGAWIRRAIDKELEWYE